MEEFKYNNSISHKQNFAEWYYMNSKERSAYGDAPLKIAVAKKRFKKYYGHLSTWVWISLD